MDERETTPSGRRPGSGREMGALVLRSAGAALLLVWALWITYLILGGPPGGKAAPLPTSPPTLAERLFHTAGHYENAGHFTRLSMVYRDLLSPESWNWRVGAEDWLVLAIGLLGLALMTLIGYLFVSCFEVHIPRGAAVPVWFAMGVGLCGVVYTFVALAGLLYQWVAWVVLAAMAGVLVVFARRARRQAVGWRQEAGGKKASGFRPLDPNLQPTAYGLQPTDYRLQTTDYTWFRPRGIVERPLAWVMAGLIALITAFTFYWAAFYPETYWDALILYLGYARGIFLEHKFPLKVVAQVGVGLGANYPHLFELTGATIATWANHWSPRYLQIATPLAGLMSLLLAYHTVLRLSRSVFLALLVALLIRAAPYWITYSTWTSNYSFVVLYSAVFFYLALRYIEDGLPGYFILATLAVAFSMHINYLMGSLWICWAAMVLLAHWPRRLSSPLSPQAIPTQSSVLSSQSSVLSPQHSVLSPQSSVLSSQSSVLSPQSSVLSTQHSALSTFCPWPGLGEFLRSGRFWMALLWGVALSSIWYIRNWIVTGNPVYAFFPKLFPGTKHLNPEVMLSAGAEWQSNGDGIGIAGPGLLDRLRFTWPYFVNNFNTCYKWAPVFMGVVVPGLLIFLAFVLWQALTPRYEDETGRRVRTLDDASRLGLLALLYMGILFIYHYAMGPFYMYHLFGCFAVFGVFVYYALRSCPRPVLWLFGAWAVFAGLMPGLPWAIMGPLGSPRLTALRNPGMPQRDFYGMKYGGEIKMWDKVNALCKNTSLLTHENRAMLFDPSIRLVHMDDWELQRVWGKPGADRLETLRKLGVRYYLQVPMERKHAVNARLGHGEWLTDGTLEKVFEAGGDTLYRFHYPSER